MVSRISAVLLLVALAPVSASTASAEIFPSLRKRKLAAVQKTVPQLPEKEKAAPQVPAGEPLAVPSVADVGSDGFPVLPGVTQMLDGASSTMKSVSSQASGLQARVVQAQMLSETKMAKQKAAFEEKLKFQELGNQKVIEANANITAENKRLQSSNAASKKRARDIEKYNKVMRSQLQTLESRVGIARDFTVKSLTATDDSKSALLQVLKKGGAKHHVFVETSSRSKRDADDDDDDTDSSDSDESDDNSEDDEDNDNDGVTSLLSLSRTVRRALVNDGIAVPDLDAEVPAGPSLDAAAAAPGDLLAALAKDVAHLAQQEKESEAHLKQLFIRDYRAGVRRDRALLAQQKTLVATRTSLLNVQSQLKKAEAHVDGTRMQLENRLHGLGQYLQKLAHFAMAPQHEVKQLLEVLPKVVALKGEKAM